MYVLQLSSGSKLWMKYSSLFLLSVAFSTVIIRWQHKPQFGVLHFCFTSGIIGIFSNFAFVRSFFKIFWLSFAFNKVESRENVFHSFVLVENYLDLCWDEWDNIVGKISLFNYIAFSNPQLIIFLGYFCFL